MTQTDTQPDEASGSPERRTLAPESVEENRRVSARLRAQSAQEDQFLRVRLATTLLDHLEAFHILHDQYVGFGYMAAHPQGVRIMPYNLSQSAHTFVALRGANVVGTVTCIEDEGGLPAEQRFGAEIAGLRGPGSKLVEVCGLAISKTEAESTVLMELIRGITIYCRNLLGATDWVITINPRHQRFYERLMLFEALGDPILCMGLNGAPARLMRLNLVTMPQRYAAYFRNAQGSKNLHSFLFDPHKESQMLARLRAAQQERARCWALISRSMALAAGE